MTDPRSDDLQRRLEVAFKRNGLTMPNPLTAQDREAMNKSDWNYFVKGFQKASPSFFAQRQP